MNEKLKINYTGLCTEKNILHGKMCTVYSVISFSIVFDAFENNDFKNL